MGSAEPDTVIKHMAYFARKWQAKCAARLSTRKASGSTGKRHTAPRRVAFGETA